MMSRNNISNFSGLRMCYESKKINRLSPKKSDLDENVGQCQYQKFHSPKNVLRK
jgi:hypothetical protein